MRLALQPLPGGRQGRARPHGLDLYAGLDLADPWTIIGPVNWYAPSSNLKLMFDRLVYMNGGKGEPGRWRAST